jgi:hypothetical protein
VVRRTEFAVGHARAHSAQDDIVLAVGHICLDLFQGTPGEERPGCANEGDEAGVGQACSYTDHILLGNSHVD